MGLNRTKHFTQWLLKRAATAILSGPRRVHEYFVYHLHDDWFPALMGYILSFIGAGVLVLMLLAVCEVTKEVGFPILYGFCIGYVAYLIAVVIQIQYRIYCYQLERTMDRLKRSSYDDAPF